MANQNNIGGVITTTNPQIESAGFKSPVGINDSRSPGQIEKLFIPNSKLIYNKLSPKTNHSGFLKFGPKEPYISIKIDKGHSGVNGLKRYESRAFPLGSALQDVERITKWSFSSNGVVFLAKQLLLQSQNAFNETKIYNPLLPIVAVLSKASFGILPTPTHHLDFSNGLLSIFGFGGKDVAPKGTVGEHAVSNIAKKVSNPYKGLLRGATASSAFISLEQKWGENQKSSPNSIKNYFKVGFNRIFGGLIPVGQPGEPLYRADEKTYGLMLANKTNFGTGVYQRWTPGIELTNNNTPTGYSRSVPFLYSNTPVSFSDTGYIKNRPFGIFDFDEKNPEGSKYLMYIGKERFSKGGENGIDEKSLEFSDQIVNYAYYIGELKTNVKHLHFERGSKLSDPTDLTVKSIIDNLKEVLTSLNTPDINSNDVKYTLNNDAGTDTGTGGYPYTALPQYNVSKNVYGYNYIGENQYLNSARFSGLKTLDPIPLGNDTNKTLGFAGKTRSDKINTLPVLDRDHFGRSENGKYSPYEDDQIAFYFRDIVNDKFIPFRAIVKGISESLTAEWNDISYIGRADKLYTYRGFTRSLAFNFTVHINTIKELLPTWQRINYFCGLIKPANYTGIENSNFSRFIIPPIIEVNIGDLYKEQPAVITAIGFAVPEDALWENLSEAQLHTDKDWNYLNNVIVWKDSGKEGKYAQLPKCVDISVSLNLLEKVKPQIGVPNFGDLKGVFSKQMIVNNRTI